MNESRDVFISYHTNSAQDTVRKISVALEAAGISCWYAPRDCGDDYARSIVQAIRHCKIFLLILNSSSNMSEHCKNEVNIAFDRFKAHDGIVLLPFRIDDCVLSDDMYYYLGRIHIMDGGLPPELLKVRELTNRILTLLDRNPEVKSFVAERDLGEKTEGGTPVQDEQDAADKQYAIVSRIIYPNQCFCGRENELMQIEQGLQKAQNKVFLVGMGGIGKSELAKKYIAEHGEEYAVILWIQFHDSLTATFCDDGEVTIEGISRAQYANLSDTEYAKRKLRILRRIADRRVLLVIDNFDVDGDPLLEELTSGEYAVIITTRNHQQGSQYPEIAVRAIDEEDTLMQIFRDQYVRMIPAQEEPYVHQIISILGKHTLSIRLIAATMRNKRIRPSQMAGILTERFHQLDGNQTGMTLVKTKLQEVFRLSELEEQEVLVLKNLSVIPLSGISVEVFCDWCGGVDYAVIDGLISRSWILYDPVWDKIHLHPLIARMFRESVWDKPGDMEEFLTNLSDALSWEKDYNTALATSQEKYNLINYVVKYISPDSPAYERLLEAKIAQTHRIGLYLEMVDDCKYLIANGKQPEPKGYGYLRLAHISNQMCDAEASYRYAYEGYQFLYSIPEEEMTDRLYFMRCSIGSRLVDGYIDQGEYENALELQLKLLPESYQWYEITPEQSYAWNEYHLCRIYRKLGNNEKAEETIRDAIHKFQSKNDQWSVFFAWQLLAELLAERGEQQEAETLVMRALDQCRTILGDKHVDYGQSEEFVGNVENICGKAAEAQAHWNIAWEIYNTLGYSKRAEILKNKMNRDG